MGIVKVRRESGAMSDGGRSGHYFLWIAGGDVTSQTDEKGLSNGRGRCDDD